MWNNVEADKPWEKVALMHCCDDEELMVSIIFPEFGPVNTRNPPETLNVPLTSAPTSGEEAGPWATRVPPVIVTLPLLSIQSPFEALATIFPPVMFNELPSFDSVAEPFVALKVSSTDDKLRFPPFNVIDGLSSPS